AQGGDLFTRQRTPAPARESMQGHWTKADPDKPFDFVADAVKHFADLPFHSLRKGHTQYGGSDDGDPFGPCFSFRDVDSLEQLRDVIRVEWTIDPDFVLFLHLELRMKEVIREIPVVRDEEQTFALHVEPPYVKDARPPLREQVEDRAASLFVAGGADIAP